MTDDVRNISDSVSRVSEGVRKVSDCVRKNQTLSGSGQMVSGRFQMLSGKCQRVFICFMQKLFFLPQNINLTMAKFVINNPVYSSHKSVIIHLNITLSSFIN